MYYTVTQTLKNLIISALLIFSPQIINAEIINKIVAQVGPNVITLYDLEQYAPKRLEDIYRESSADVQTKKFTEYFDEAYNSMVDTAILKQAAERIGIVVSGQEIDSALLVASMENIQFRDLSNRILTREGKMTPELSNMLTQYIIRAKIRPFITERIVITEEDVLAYYIEINGKPPVITYYDLTLVLFDSASSYEEFAKSSKDFDSAVKTSGAGIINMGWVLADNLLADVKDKIAALGEPGLTGLIIDQSGRIMVAKINGIRHEQSIPKEEYNLYYKDLMDMEYERIYDLWLANSRSNIIIVEYGI